jgi:hypothetical protein
MKMLSRNVRYTLAVLGAAAGMVLGASQHAAASGGEMATYTVTAPVTGYSLIAGSTILVTWTSSSPGSSNVNISLVDSTGWFVADVIANNTPDDGSESYTIPANLPAGRYLIYIEDVGVTSWTFGPAFDILECGSTRLNVQRAGPPVTRDRGRPMPRDRRAPKIPAPDPER